MTVLDAFKVVFFDAGGTLLHPYPSVGEIYASVALRHGCRQAAQVLEERFRGAWIERDGLAGLISGANEKIEREWWRELVTNVFQNDLAKFKDYDAFFEELYDLFAGPSCWRLYPDVMDVLRQLKREGKKLGIISNWDSRLQGLTDKLGLSRHMEFILISSLVGFSKPSPRIFEEALKRAGVRPAEAVHIGDSYEDDVKGAESVGMKAIWINRHPEHRSLPHPEADAVITIHQLSELTASPA